MVGLRGSSQTLGSHLPSSFHQKQKDKTIDSPRVLISFSYTRNKKKSSSTRYIRLIRVTNSRSVAHKSWMARCFPRVPVFASTSLQQRQFISLASFLQCWYLHQSKFPILICNKSTAEA